MIGIALNSNKTSISKLRITANKLLLVSTNVVIVTNDKQVESIFGEHPNISVISQQKPFTNKNQLGEIYAASSIYPDKTDFITLSTEYDQLRPSILTTLVNNSNCYAATIDHSYYQISHFNISNPDLSQYLHLDDLDLKQFITQEMQCLPLTFSSGDMF
ncbi:hypothetical protein [Companilactobacillus baiquanensis]|uniref:Uncharacterized protein n=1 Tax=Companilactobacillus baiquanensis TaxID=2486005 RepID=A0ABW1USE1_9LACO|nr:hypothetical protein [Companilactobacillus baiquanensis]